MQEIPMANYRVTMQHSEKTFELLSRKQYDLFCRGNRVSRLVIMAVCVYFGITNFEQWWGILLTAYGCYMLTSTYAQPNHTAHKLAKQIRERGMPFPAAEYVFRKNYMEIIVLPVREDEANEQVKYKELECIAEDGDYFYLFRNQYGGYMVPKDQLQGKIDEFRFFLEEQSGQICQVNAAPWVKLIRKMSSPNRKK